MSHFHGRGKQTDLIDVGYHAPAVFQLPMKPHKLLARPLTLLSEHPVQKRERTGCGYKGDASHVSQTAPCPAWKNRKLGLREICRAASVMLPVNRGSRYKSTPSVWCQP